jgi:general secretion pathway protein D
MGQSFRSSLFAHRSRGWLAAGGCLAVALAVRCAAADENTPPASSNAAARGLAVAASLPPPPESGAYINFSFDQVDVPAFVKLVGDLTGRRFVVSDAVKGKITVVSPRISQKDVYPLFVSILEAAGCSVVEEGGIFRIIPLPERPTPLGIVVGAGEKIPASGFLTKVFRLQHVAASDVRRLLETKVPGGKAGAVGCVEETNHIVVTDTADNIRRIEKLIGEIDQPGMAQTTDVVPLKFISSEDLAQELNAAISEVETRADALRRRLPAPPETSQGGERRVIVVASPHSNSVLLVGSTSQIGELKRIIAMMDVDTAADRGRLNAIFLKYISAEEAARTLNALLGNPVTSTNRSAPAADSGGRKRRIAIEPSESQNALLVDATPGDFELVRRLVDQMDQAPQQVHIEVLIAEMSEGDSLDFGVEMASIDLPTGIGDIALQGAVRPNDNTDSVMTTVQNGLFPRGLSVGVARGSHVNAAGNVVSGYPALININALKKDSRLKIRSNPSLMAQNNKEASVNIVNQIPVLKSTVQGSGASRDVIQNIERVDVGIKLKLTPSVIPGGLVRVVLNPSIEAVIDPGPSGTQFAPTIARREVSTTVTVPDGQTIVIAGLTRKDKIKVVRKIPLLGSIPILGWLFRQQSDSDADTNVLIFVTPRVVTEMLSAAKLTEIMEKKAGLKADESAP